MELLGYGSFAIFSWLVFPVAILVAVVAGLAVFKGIPKLRKHFEGIAYGVSFSATFGTLAMIGYGWAVGELVRRYGVPNTYVREWWWHAAWVGLALIARHFLYNQPKGHLNEIDAFFNGVVAPLTVYLVGSSIFGLIPFGKEEQFVQFAVFFLAFWLLTFGVDIIQGRLDQPEFVRRHRQTGLWPLCVLLIPFVVYMLELLGSLLAPRLAVPLL